MFEEFMKYKQKRIEYGREVSNPYSLMTEGHKHEVFDRFYKMSLDFYEFLKAVRTLDESAKTDKIRQFPYDLKYIQFIGEALKREKRVAIPKSRRMKISWTCQAFMTWEGLFNVGTRQAMVSKKEEDSDELVERCKFILDHLNKEIFPRELVPQYEKTYCFLYFKDLISKIEGYPSGADQLRQFTFSRIFGDEFAFWPDAEEMYSGAEPTLEGSDGESGGQVILVSSRSPGFFKRLCYDKINNIEDFFYEDAQAELEPKSPLQGVDCWRNRSNKFFVIDLHYTADPAKRSPEWRRERSSGVSKAKWDREYEKSWDTYEGLPVFSDFVESIHTTRNPPKPEIGLPLLRGWDCTGLSPGCVVAQRQGDQLIVYKEFSEFNMGTDRFSDIVIPKCAELFPGFKFIEYADPAGIQRDSSDEGQSILILDDKTNGVTTGIQAWDKRRKSIEDYLLGFSPKKNQPNLLIDKVNCPTLVRGFNGGYRYNEKNIDRETKKVRPVKDEHSHVHDALQYLCTGFSLSGKRMRAAGSQRKQLSYSSNRNSSNNQRIFNTNTDFGRMLKRRY